MGAILIRLAILIALVAGLALAVSNADRADSSAQVWVADGKVAALLQKPSPFDVYDIRLPLGFTQSQDDAPYQDARRTEWVGPIRPDTSQPSMSVWVAQLTPDQAAGDPIALGSKLLEDSGRTGSTDYVRTKSEVGMVNGNWVTRFYDTCEVQTPNAKIRLRAANYIWIDRGRLVMATAYDAINYIKETMPILEASIFSIVPSEDAEAQSMGGDIPVGGP